MAFLPAEIIKAKRNGRELSFEEINEFILGYARGQIPDYQMSALLMATFFKGMTTEETLSLTKAMLHSGEVVDFSSVPGFKVDKHSTGGVGDKTSLILGPIVAAAGVPVPMISGRGLGHTGGTLDKLESIPGFNTQKSLPEFVELVRKHAICFIGQTKEICPADKKIYALRDVTATVESLPLICASIMSKKLAEGIDGLVLDVKYGSGAFMKTPALAEELALNLMAIAKGYGKKVTSLLTNMDQPLGRFAGNSLEVEECVAIMKNEKFVGPGGYDLYEDTRELSLQLSAHMLLLAGVGRTVEESYKIATDILTSGKAMAKFEELCVIHGGNLKALPKPKFTIVITAEKAGYVHGFHTESIGIAGIIIKAGRAQTTDIIAPTAGIEFHVKVGDEVKMDDAVFTLHGDDKDLLQSAVPLLKSAINISLPKITKPSLILKTLS
ncbi:MAG: pyrimidine-nucleoside phosphorylase [Bdellovibrio sp. ArHS]|uniref:thymidine phosphorylase n=1 Tax=Bdellovibrio sp. ArHS TaxID=1569284 RepID=UPI0005832011|nr:thymidine phosphorylase [Bdellovibrio sp. ArHS]KHD87990.1 MAG: pyrimidine-nucleoside phosphorylase [Bdellovibrio sp. ArHS]